MSVKRFQTRISLKTDTTANWKESTLQLLKGEFGWDSTLKNFKVGTGVSNESGWTNLMYAIPFFEAGEFTLTDIPASGQGENAGKTVVSINKVNSSKVIYGITPTQGTLIGDLATSTGADPSSSLDLRSILNDFDAKIRAAQASGVQSIGGATGAVTLGNGLTSTIGANGSVSTLVNGYIVNNAGANNKALDLDSSKIDSDYTSGATNLATVGTVSAAIGSLDVSEFALATQSGNAITIHGIKEEDGEIAVGTDSTKSITLAEVASTGAAADVAITDSGNNFTATNVEAALAELATGVAGGVSDVKVDDDSVVTTVNGKKVAQLLSSDGYSANNKLATQSTVTSAIGALDVDNISGMAASRTIATLTETDGKIAATFQNISITHTQVSDWNANIGVKSVALGSQGEGISAVPTLQVTTGGTSDDTVSNVLHFTHTPSSTEKVLTSSDLTGIVGAMVYQGTIGTGGTTTTLPTAAAANKGHVYMVKTAGTYADKDCEVGDMIVSNGTSWDVINGENQVTNGNPTIVAGAADASTIATVDGNAVTAKVSVTAGSAEIASESNGVVTLKAGVTQTGTTGTIYNDSNPDIVLAKVATTGAATDLTVTSATYGGSEDTTNAQTALTNLASAITNANITIDGHKGAIYTGNGLSHVTADGGSFAVQLDTDNANGLSVGSDGIAMAKATGRTFGTVEVTAGNGLTLNNGVVAYAHNTTAITVATNTNGVVILQGTLTPDAGDTITGSNQIQFNKVATSGAAADISVADIGNNFATDTVEAALAELAGKTAGTLDTTATEAQTVDDESLSGNVTLHKISKTASTDDLLQGLTILLDCGTASTVTNAPGSGDISNDAASTPAV